MRSVVLPNSEARRAERLVRLLGAVMLIAVTECTGTIHRPGGSLGTDTTGSADAAEEDLTADQDGASEADPIFDGVGPWDGTADIALLADGGPEVGSDTDTEPTDVTAEAEGGEPNDCDPELHFETVLWPQVIAGGCTQCHTAAGQASFTSFVLDPTGADLRIRPEYLHMALREHVGIAEQEAALAFDLEVPSQELMTSLFTS